MDAHRTMVRWAYNIVKAVDDLLYPPHCLLSGEPISTPSPLPMIGREGLDACDPAPDSLTMMLTAQRHHDGDELWLTSITSLFAVGTDHGIDAAIHAIKYRGHERLATALGWYASPLLDQLPHRPDAVIPVPIHAARRRERGYNQAELIANGLVQDGAVPVRCALQRTVNTTSQTTLSDARRRTNVQSVFDVVPEADVAGLRLVVVDDIFTTGSTLNACAEVLIERGARRVDAITIGATV